jgi:hypothetical protein
MYVMMMDDRMLEVVLQDRHGFSSFRVHTGRLRQ